MSDLGSLSHCLVDSDTEATSRARRLRRTALLISLALEAGLVAAMLLWPFITPGVLPRQFNVTPAPPFHGGGRAGANHPHESSRPHPPTVRPPTIWNIFPPPVIPLHAPVARGDEPPPITDDGDPSGPGTRPAGPGIGPSIPGAGGDGHPVVLPPPPPSSSGPLLLSKGVMEASLIHRVQPIYPPVAKAMHLSGTVELRALIGEDGAVRQLQILSGNPLLAQAAVAAVREWRYRPTLLSGKPVEVETRITVSFLLQ